MVNNHGAAFLPKGQQADEENGGRPVVNINVSLMPRKEPTPEETAATTASPAPPAASSPKP
jgi:hypothetical protein